MCVGRRINEDGTSDLKEEVGLDTKEFLKRIKDGIKDIDIPFYKVRVANGQKKNNLTTFQKQ